MVQFSNRANTLIGQEMFKIADQATELESRGHRICHLELGAVCVPPPLRLIESSLRMLKSGYHGYTLAGGLTALRQKIAEKFGCGELTAANVAITPANFAISQFLTIASDQTTPVVLFSPAFPTYMAASAHLCSNVYVLPLNEKINWELTREDVDHAVYCINSKSPTRLRGCRGAIIVNSANNPTGAVYPLAVMSYLIDKCEEHDIWLLIDETYERLRYVMELPECYFIPRLQEKVVRIGSLSKLFGVPGYRVGYVIADSQFIEKVVLSISTSISCLSSFTQAGVLAALDEIDNHCMSLRVRYAPLMRQYAALVNDSRVLRCDMPMAAYYLFLNIGSTGLNSVEFAKLALEDAYVAVTPGKAFGGVRWDQYVRLACGGSVDEVTEGIKRLICFVRDHRRDGAIL